MEPILNRISDCQPGGNGATRPLNLKLTVGAFHAAVIILLATWVLHNFLEPLLAACVAAIASWPLYRRFCARVRHHLPRSAAALIFTVMMAVFVLAPLLFALGALLTEASTILQQIAAADSHGIQVPEWLKGWSRLAAFWKSQLGRPGALQLSLQQIDRAALLGLSQSFGLFMLRHLFIIVFTILILFFLYLEGGPLAQGFRRVLRHRIGERAECYVGLATRSLRASVNSMLVVGLFDGFATALAYAIVGAPHPLLWAAITGALALVPFLGYAAVAALTLQLSMAGATTAALLACGLGCVALFCGDKIVRPLVASGGTHLGFVWVLMGCLGGFQVLGVVGLVIGPVLLTLTRELWEERVRAVAASESTPPTSALAVARAGAILNKE